MVGWDECHVLTLTTLCPLSIVPPFFLNVVKQGQCVSGIELSEILDILLLRVRYVKITVETSEKAQELKIAV